MSIATIVKSLGDEKPRLNELGKIKIGGLGQEREKKGGGTYRTPRKDDHFTITTLHRHNGRSDGDLLPDEDLMAQLIGEYGDGDGKLRRIPIRLLSDKIDDVLQTAWLWYCGKTLGARSDGEKLTWFYHPDTRRRYEKPVEADWQEGDQGNFLSAEKPIFKLHSVFNCVIAAKEARWGGVYKFRTTSQISFGQLYGSLLHISQLTGGVLRGMPLQLCVRPIQVSPEGKSTTVYVVHVELRGGELIEIQRQALEQARWAIENKTQMEEAQKQYRALLVAPGTEDKAAAAEISEEYHPEAQTIDSAPDAYDLIDGDAAEPPATIAPTPAPDALFRDSGPADEVSTWSAFAEAVVAMAIRDNITEPTAEAALQVLRRTNCGSKQDGLASPARRNILGAIEHGAFDWNTGTVKAD